MPRSTSIGPTQRGAQTRAARRSMPRSIASIALDSGAGLPMKPGIWLRAAWPEGPAKPPRTRSVSMKPK